MPNPPEQTINQNSLFQMVYAFQRSRIVLTAFELGLFTVLGEGSKTAAETAVAAGTHPRATERLMDALCALELLKKEGSRYFNAPAAQRFFVKGRPDYMSGLGHAVHLWDSWSTMTQAVRHGGTVRTAGIGDRGEKWLTAFIAAMHWRASRRAPEVAALLDFTDVRCVLDVGGGSGAFAMAFVQSKEGLRATVFDLPAVAPLTKSYIEEAGLSDRVTTATGDYLKDDLGSGYDLAFLSAVVHSNSAEQNRLLISKCFKALNAGGRIVIQDFVMDEGRASPVVGALFSLNMLVATESGDTYRESEIRAWLLDAGFGDITRTDTGFDTTLIIARK